MKALVLLYYWPPSGGPGVQPGVKLCGGLLREGIEPVVVTVEPTTYRLPGEYAPDPSLAADAPRGLRVVQTPSGYRAGARALLSRTRLFRAAWHIDPARWFERQSGWLAPATAALIREIRTSQPDVLLTSSQPYTAHLAGRAAKLATGIPWVADFRDPWTFAWGRSWPSQRALDWELRREEEVLGDADIVLANTPGTRDEFLERRPWLDPAKVRVVRNGYDPEDFHVEAVRKPAGEFRIVHAGSFRARAPGGRRRGLRSVLDRKGPEPVPYDLSTHSPGPLFDAIARLSQEDRALVRVRLVGSVDPGWMRVAHELGVASSVVEVGYLPHRDTTAELLAADLLWLPTITRRDGGRVSNVPAKTYEYLGSGRGILSLAGPGDVRDLLAGRARCQVAAPGSQAVRDVTEALATAVNSGSSATEPDPEDARPFRRSETARGVALALRAAVSADPSPASVPAQLDQTAPGGDHLARATP